jgi:hypothetical protein
MLTSVSQLLLLLVLFADGLLQALGRRSLIERLLGHRYPNPYWRLPAVAVYLVLLGFVFRDDFSSWPWDR